MKTAVLVCALTALAASAANASVTLQFTNFSFMPYTESGFQVTSANPGWSTTSSNLVGQAVNSVTTARLSQINGDPFDLLSLQNLLLVGNAADTMSVFSPTGASVVQSTVFETPTFSGPDWTGILYVDFVLTCTTTVGASTRIDNVVLNPSPTPGAAGLLLIGALPLARRRR